jgi:hypothetical protein
MERAGGRGAESRRSRPRVGSSNPNTVQVIEHDFFLDLTVTGGTRRFKHETGSLSLDYRTHTQLGGFGCVVEPIPGLDFEVCGKAYDGATLTGAIGH